MKSSLVLICSLLMINTTAQATSDSVSGVVTMAKSLEKVLTPGGALFIIAKRANQAPGQPMPPIAVAKIQAPKFPQNFTLGPQNSMMGGKFEGPMTITARYSASGDAMDKSGPEGSDSKATSVNVGKSDLKIELKAK